jgi:lysozyme
MAEQLIKGVDVSHHQNDRAAIDWAKVVAAGYEFAMVKLTEGSTFVDPCGVANVNDARSAGMKYVGGYHFAHFNSVDDAKIEAAHFNEVASGLNLDFVVLDIEHKEAQGDLSDAVSAFLDAVSANGKPVLYSYTAFIKAHLGGAKLVKYPLWIARYGVSDPGSNGAWGANWSIWQHDSQAIVDGISGNCDVNVAKAEFLASVVPKPTPAPVVVKPAPKPVAHKPAPAPTHVEWRNYVIKSGDTLSELAVKYDTTVAALQAHNHIKHADDIFAGHTIQVPEKVADNVSKQSIVSYPGHVIARNSADKHNVERVQRAVDAKVDGVFGAKTEAAVKAYQKRHGLTVDGVVGPKTWAKLF